jgi:hypothetical protein
MTREIQLSRGLVALVDDTDYERAIAAGKWYAQSGWRTFYATRNVQRAGGSRTKLLLHMFLTGWSYVDHINGDGLDNRQTNLRPATHAENARNRRMHSDNASGFKGVFADRRRWRAGIVTNGARRDLGCWGTAEEAARAYDSAAREFHGEFARLNFPDEVN